MPYHSIIALLLATTTIASHSAGVAAAPPATQLLPAATKAFATTDDIQRLNTDWEKCQVAAIFADAKMRPFVDALKKMRRTNATDDATSAMVTWDDLLSISAGSASAGVVAMKDNTAASILLVDTHGKRPQVASLMKRLADMYTRVGAQRSDRTIANQHVVAYAFKTTVDKTRYDIVHLYFRRDEIFGTTDSLALLTDVLNRWDAKPSDSLANLDSFQSIRRRSSRGIPVGQARGEWFLDPFGYQQLVQDSEQAVEGSSWQRATRQGFAGIEAIGGTVSFSAGEFDVVHQLAIYAPQPLKKAAGMFALKPIGDAQIPEWIPANIGRAAILGWDLSAAFTAYGSWFDEVYGEGETGIFEEVVLGIRDDPGSPGVDIRKDLIAHLEGPVIIAGGSASLEPNVGDPLLLAVQVSDVARVQNAIDKMLTGDPDVERRNIGPVRAWVFRDTSKQRAEDDGFLGPDLSNCAVCVHEGFMIVATDAGLLGSVLSEGAKIGSLTTDPRYKRVMGAIDSRTDTGTVLRHFADPRVDLRLLYRHLRSGTLENVTSPRGRLAAALITLMSPPTAGRQLPVTKLPTFSAVQPYLGDGGTIGSRDDDGWSIRSFVLAKEK